MGERKKCCHHGTAGVDENRKMTKEDGLNPEQSKERTVTEFKDLMNRLNRIEGQIKGLKRMVEENAYCLDILIQSSAASSALNSFNRVLMGNHIRSCVVEDIREGNMDTVDELLKILQKLMK